MSLEETGSKMSSNFCRVITAEYGYFVRIDFRDMFRIEPASNDGKCAYDYLEVGRKKISRWVAYEWGGGEYKFLGGSPAPCRRTEAPLAASLLQHQVTCLASHKQGVSGQLVHLQ